MKKPGVLGTIRRFMSALPEILDTIPRTITICTSIVTSIGAFLAAISALGLFGQAPQYEITPMSYKEFPYSLKKSMKAHDFLYWFKIRVRNESSSALHLKVSFHRRRGENVVVDAPPAVYTVEAGENDFVREVDPGFVFLQREPPEELEVTWSIENDHGMVLKQGSMNVRVLPRNRMIWDLRTPEDESVPRPFLLAALSAWTLTSDSTIQTLADSLLEQLPPANNSAQMARHWFETSYETLFRSSDPIRVFPAGGLLDRGEQVIHPPEDVIRERKGNVLEANLLLAALNWSLEGRIPARVGMFVLEDESSNPGERAFLFAWSIGNGPWNGLDLLRANQLPFEENHRQATARISRRVAEAPELLEALQKKGVYLSTQPPTTAIDFQTARREFSIGGLP